MAESNAELRKRVRSLAEREFRPHELDIAHARKPLKSFMPILAENGLLGHTAPARFGGQGAPFLDMMVILEEISRVSYPVAGLVQIGANLPVEFIGKLGAQATCEKYLPKVVAGTMFAEALSEPHAGSALTDMVTKVTSDGSGFRLSGRKCWVSYGNIADYIIVFTRFGDSKGSKGIGAVIVKSDAPGVRLVEGWATMANPTSPVESVYEFDNVRIEPEDVLVNGDTSNSNGFKKLMSAYNTQRLGNAANCLGLMQGAFDLAVERAKDRHQFGRPIAEFQGVQWKLADMAVKLEASRALLYSAASMEAEEALPSPYKTAVAKVLANQAVLDVTSEALQIFGGYGYRVDFPLEYRLRIARGQALAGGTLEVQKNLIASMVLGQSFPQRRAMAG